MDRRLDPRSIVTPYAFAVHPDLLGRPLATPWQRLGAILVDLIVIGFLSQIGVGPLALGSAALLLWLAFRKPGRDVFGKAFRIAVGCLGVLVLSVTLLIVLLIRYGDDLEQLTEELSTELSVETELRPEVAPGEGVSSSDALGFLEIVQGFRGAAALQEAEDPEEAQALMEEFADRAYRAGLSRAETRSLLEEILPSGAPWSPTAQEMVDEAMGRLPGPAGQVVEDPEELREETAPDEASPGETVPGEAPVEFAPAALDSIDRLNRLLTSAQEELADTEEELDRTEQVLEAERERGPLSWLWDLIDELGIGFGWAALYLTITHAWWRGSSIGKKLFRIRVVMIDKRPLNWWLSFERAGGYAAGFATGLLGFAQIFWDPNRQAIHDKVSETIVIQEGQPPVAGPWIEEGKALWTRGRHDVRETPGG